METLILTPRITEVNYGNHISNLAIMAWLEDARADISQLLNHDVNDEKFGSVIVRIDCQFKSEVFYGSVVEIETSIAVIGNSSLTINQKAFQKGILAAESTTVIVYFNSNKKCATPIPDNIRKSLKDYT